MNSLGINEVDNDVLNDADQYLREHKILELFEVSQTPCLSQIMIFSLFRSGIDKGLQLVKFKLLYRLIANSPISFSFELQDLTTLLAYKQPDNMEQFLTQQIEARIKNGSRSIVYTEAEMQNIFTLYDLKNSGHISKEQCREGQYYQTYFGISKL